MTGTVRRLGGLTLLLPGALLLAACNASTAAGPAPTPLPDAASLDCQLPDGATAIAASARSNAPRPEVTPKLRAVLDSAIGAGSHVTLVDTDSAPSLVEEGSLQLKGKNSEALEMERQAVGAQLATAIQDSRTDAPQADPLAALETAARAVHAVGPTGTVVLVDSGLQTRGSLQYQSDDLLLATGDDVVGHLRSSGQLPDLQGLTVMLTGLGDTSAPQDRLDAASRNRLVEQWTAVVKAAGAACVEIDSHPLTEAPPAGLPTVAAVPVPRPATISLEPLKPVALREDSVGFEDNSAEFRDESSALSTLEQLADDIKAGNHRILLVGTTATAGTAAGRLELSLSRAEAVKRLLVELGVPAKHIATKGVGTRHPEHVDDLDAKGNLVPALAVRNRAVFVTVKR